LFYLQVYKIVPSKKSIATVDFTKPQSLFQMIVVWKIVKNDTIARRISIVALALITKIVVGVAVPIKMVTHKTSIPRKHKNKPSATHSIRIICLLSFEISPNPSTIFCVGKR
jgi:hypothetical protein